MAGSSFTGPLKIIKSDGSKVTFVDANGDLVAGTGIIMDDGDAIKDTNSNELLVFGVTASAVNELKITNAATGNPPVFSQEGEVDIGMEFHAKDGEEILKLEATAAAITFISIKSQATGVNPEISAEGEADLGITFMNDQSEELFILNANATAVNELTISNAATGSNPGIAATGGDADLDISLTPKGTGDVSILGASGVISSVANAIMPWFLSAAQTTTTDTAAVLLTSTFTNLVTTTASVPTLADSTIKGQFKKVQFITDVGDSVLTPTTLNGGTTITFADIGDTAELIWDGAGWQVIALYNVADGTTAPVLA